MVVSLVPTGYRLDVTSVEREQLLIVAELSLALRAGDGESVRSLVLELDAPTVDGIADRLFLAAPITA